MRIMKYSGPNRSAEIELIESFWDTNKKWEIRLYVEDKVVMSRIFSSPYDAQQLAEKFVQDNFDARTLLNE